MRKNPSIAALSVQNVFFCCEFNVNTRRSFPRILSQFNRQMNIWPKGFRSKIIVLRTELIDDISIHVVSHLSKNYSSSVKHLDQTIAHMFHYRMCCDVERTPAMKGMISFPTLSDYVIIDETMKKFSLDIMQFIQKYIYL